MLYIDSGASVSIVNNTCWLKDIKESRFAMALSGITNKIFWAQGTGNLCHPLSNITVHYIPDFPTSIICVDSIRKFFKINYVNNINFKNDIFQIITHNDITIANFHRQDNGLFAYTHTVNLSTFQNLQNQGLQKDMIAFMHRAHDLHMATAYTDLDRLAAALRNNAIAGTPSVGSVTARDVENYKKYLHKLVCNGCRFGKSSSAPAPSLDNIDTCHEPGTLFSDIMHINLKNETLNYFVSIDGFTKMTFISQIPDVSTKSVIEAINEVKNIFSSHQKTLQQLHVDNARGFDAKTAKRHAHQNGIKLTFRTPGRHVRRAEANIKTIKRAFKAIILGLSYPCPHRLYSYAIKWTVQTLNLTLRKSNDFRTPYSNFTDNKISFEQHYAAKFGDVVTIRKFADDNTRVPENESRTTLGIILCRQDNFRGYSILKLDTNTIVVRHVFQKMPLPLNQVILDTIKRVGPATTNTSLGHIDEPWFDDIMNDEADNNQPPAQSLPAQSQTTTLNASDTNVDINIGDEDENDSNTNSDSDDDHLSDIVSISSNDSDDMTIRDNSPSLEIAPADTVSMYEEPSEPLPQLPNPRRSQRSYCPNPRIYGYSRRDFALLANPDNMSIKQSAKKLGDEKTNEAVWKELSQLITANVWTMIKREDYQQKRCLPSHLFLKAKTDANNNFTKLKARLVALGNRDPNPPPVTESPTASITTILMVLTIAVKRKWFTSTVDVTGAYLHADLDREVHMILGPNIANIMKSHVPCQDHILENGTIVVKLNKCLYGLKESGRQWYLLLSQILTNNGLTQSIRDPCLFHSNDCLIAIYVDDLLITTSNKDRTSSIHNALQNAFTAITINEGDNISFLGINIRKIGDDIALSQEGYISKICEDKTLGDRVLPHDHKFSFSATVDDTAAIEKNVKNRYLSILMKKMYLATRTRPDILINTAILASRKNPVPKDFKDLDTLLAYLKTSQHEALFIRHKGPIAITIYCDASHATHADKKSHSGYAIFMDKHSGAIATKSKKQKLVSASSTEAEIIAMYDAVKHGLWIKELLQEIGVNTPPIKVHEDNASAIHITSRNPILKGYSKFIDIKYRILNHHYCNNQLIIVFTPSVDQVADILTKPLKDKALFAKFKSKLLGTLAQPQ